VHLGPQVEGVGQVGDAHRAGDAALEGRRGPDVRRDPRGDEVGGVPVRPSEVSGHQQRHVDGRRELAVRVMLNSRIGSSYQR
jgi:hypothetical protein